MSAATSPGTGRNYGVLRVCQTWKMPRSTFYASRSPVPDEANTPVGKRGPRTLLSDDELLAAIHKDLERSPWQGEGHRKVWARLRVLDGIRVGRKRVLRLMKVHHLLSPHRGRQGEPDPHDGRITTDAPDIMWGTDGVKVFTLEEGWVWVFGAVDHWNAECVGWHVCKKGDRFAALQPIAMGLEAVYGGVTAGIARGLSLRMDHGSQYLADHFLKQVKFWGIQPSYGFVEEPQTNGVAERFNRTLKEQAINGRIFRNAEEVRQAVRTFAERYNREWLVEKLGFISPSQARADWQDSHALKAAA